MSAGDDFRAFTAMKRTQMNEPTITPIAPHVCRESNHTALHVARRRHHPHWEHEDGRWVLARAWLQGDRLEHVRRWSFAQPIPFSRQVRRLIMEANGDVALARDEGLRALAWTEAAS